MLESSLLLHSKWKFVLVVALVCLSITRAQTCEFIGDTCGLLFNGVCDADSGACPANTDCFDCDPCAEWKFDCEACTANGCHYCATDTVCSSQALLEDFWAPFDGQIKTGCSTASDWTTAACGVNTDNVYSDPLYSANEWLFDQLNVRPVWEQGFTGKGVMVRVNDPDGVDGAHAEFSGRFDAGASCDGYEPVVGLDGSLRSHGTAVASLAVAGGNNGECAVGIAPGAALSACSGFFVYSDEHSVQFLSNGIATTDISINSWGFDACYERKPEESTTVNRGGRLLQDGQCPFVGENDNPCTVCPEEGAELTDPMCEAYMAIYCEQAQNREVDYVACAEYQDRFIDCDYNVLSDAGQETLARGVSEGRNGKGIIYMFAAGNEYKKWEDVNFEGWLNTRFTTVVAGLDKDGKHASYSSTGAAVFVSGPGGDWDNVFNQVVASPGGGCFDATFGTSFATPSVAAAIALVLDANSNLTWRDIQGIIASTSRTIDSESPTWTTNGAQLRHSNLYGFGLMDATAAVEAAKMWINYGPETQTEMDSGPVNLPIVDDPGNISISSLSVSPSVTTIVESAVVYLQLEHASRGDVEVILTSPSGTKSVLHPGRRRENTHLEGEERWKLLTVRNYGENAEGEWTLSLSDKRSGAADQCVDYPYKVLVDVPPSETKADLGCDAIQVYGFCVNGTLAAGAQDFLALYDESSRKNAVEACCVCGGGFNSPVTSSVLVSWKLAIYGHDHQVYGTGSSGTSGGGSSGSGSSNAASGGILMQLTVSLCLVLALTILNVLQLV